MVFFILKRPRNLFLIINRITPKIYSILNSTFYSSRESMRIIKYRGISKQQKKITDYCGRSYS